MSLQFKIAAFFLLSVGLQVFFFGYSHLGATKGTASISSNPQTVNPQTVQEDESLPQVQSKNVQRVSSAPRPSAHPAAPPKKRTEVVVHEIKKGETFASILSKYASRMEQVPVVSSVLKGLGVKSSAFKVGEKIEVAIKDDDLTRVRLPLSDGRTAIVLVDSKEGYSAYYSMPQVREQQKIVTATIHNSFIRSALDAGLPYPIIDELVDLFSHRIEFSKDIQPGDTFSVILNEKSFRGRDQALDAHIVAASMRIQDRTYAVLRYVAKDGRARYYDEKGALLGSYMLRYPLQFTKITSVFTDARMHPILNVSTPHHGVDFAAPIGTAVRSVASGSITVASFQGGAGNMIEVKHSDRLRTVYMHLSGFAKGLKPGTHVSRGQVIGYVGSTGLSTGPHLDYRIAIGGTYVNPLTVKLPQLMSGEAEIPSRFLEATLRTLNAHHDDMTVARRELKSAKSNA